MKQQTAAVTLARAPEECCVASLHEYIEKAVYQIEKLKKTASFLDVVGVTVYTDVNAKKKKLYLKNTKHEKKYYHRGLIETFGKTSH